MMVRDAHIQQIAEEQGLGSLVRGYVPPSSGLYGSIMGAGVVMIAFFIIFASRVSIGQCGLCGFAFLAFMEAYYLLPILYAFLHRISCFIIETLEIFVT